MKIVISRFEEICFRNGYKTKDEFGIVSAKSKRDSRWTLFVDKRNDEVNINFFEDLERKNKRGKYMEIDVLVPMDLLELYEKIGG
jgi:hypothetical protein